MAGLFEIYGDAQAQYRFRLLDAARLPLAEASSTYRSKSEAVDAVTALREAAASGHIVDRCSDENTVAPQHEPCLPKASGR